MKKKFEDAFNRFHTYERDGRTTPLDGRIGRAICIGPHCKKNENRLSAVEEKGYINCVKKEARLSAAD